MITDIAYVTRWAISRCVNGIYTGNNGPEEDAYDEEGSGCIIILAYHETRFRDTPFSFLREYIDPIYPHMRFSIWIAMVTVFLMINIYTEGRYWNMVVQAYNPKYAQMGMVLVGGILLYISVVKLPHIMLRHLLVLLEWGKNQPTGYSSSVAKPVSFSGSAPKTVSFSGSAPKTVSFSGSAPKTVSAVSTTLPLETSTPRENSSGLSGKMMYAIRRITGSGKESTGKRTVSETKKKYVAAQQHWKCHTCGCLLPAWFEVDHVQRVEHGGSNHPDNLVALCRNCHGQKTSFENL